MKIRKKRRAHEPVSENVLNMLLNAAENQRDSVIIHTLVYTGMRRSDVCKLEVRNFDLKMRRIRVREQKKTKQPVHLPIISDGYFRVLKNYIGSLPKNTQWLFPSRKYPDKHIAERTLNHIFDLAKDEAGLEDVTPHDLRTTFITRASYYGIPLKVVCTALKMRPSTAMKYYEKLTAEQEDEQFQKLSLD